MPQFSYPIPDIYQMITRPVIVAVIKQIMEGTGIHQDSFIEYKGEQGQVPTWRTFIDRRNVGSIADSKMPFIEKVQVEVDENPLEEFILSTPYHYPDNKRVWHDPNLDITLSPFYQRAEYTINFTYRTPDKGSAVQWRNGMRRRFKLKFTDMSMLANYQIIIPPLILVFLKKMWEMRENISGYGDTWSEYFLSNRLQKLVKLVDQAGNNPEIAIDETQLDILGNFEFTDPPREERQEDGSCYLVNFSYKFRFDHPMGFVLKYPLVIHNQLVPPNMRPDKPHRYDPHGLLGNSSQSMSRYDVIVQQECLRKEGEIGGHLVPWFDDWFPTMGYHNTSPLLQLLCRVDPDDPTMLIDLGQLSQAGLKISETTEKYMRDNYDKLHLHAASAIYIAVYIGQDRLDSRGYYITKDLAVRTRVPMDMRNNYHVVISVMDDLLVLTPDARKTLQRNPAAFKEIVTTLEPSIDPDSIETLSDVYIPDLEYQRVSGLVQDSSEWYNRKVFLIRPTVMGGMVTKPES